MATNAKNQIPIAQGQNMSKTVQVELVFDGKEFNLEKITADYVKKVISKRFGIFMSGISLKAQEVVS